MHFGVTNKFTQTVAVVVCAFFIFGMFAYAFSTGAKLPDVYFSNSTGECVEVKNYIEGHKYTCENLPSRYYHVWVQ